MTDKMREWIRLAEMYFDLETCDECGSPKRIDQPCPCCGEDQ